MHFVKLNCGRIVQGKSEEDDIMEKVAYQRLCVGTEDGGVLSLDWSDNLKLEEERGLDTTILIVSGTTEGSYERKIKRFVRVCLRRGAFPVVMNPRGCARSPLTTLRGWNRARSAGFSSDSGQKQDARTGADGFWVRRLDLRHLYGRHGSGSEEER